MKGVDESGLGGRIEGQAEGGWETMIGMENEIQKIKYRWVLRFCSNKK